MGLFSLMYRKKPASSGSLGSGSSLHERDLNSRGRITPRELPYIKRNLIRNGGLTHSEAERVMEQLNTNLDTDGRLGGRNVSSKEVDNILDTLKKSRYNHMDSGDLDTTRKILEEYQ
jgi:hypothetical protein